VRAYQTGPIRSFSTNALLYKRASQIGPRPISLVVHRTAARRRTTSLSSERASTTWRSAIGTAPASGSARTQLSSAATSHRVPPPVRTLNDMGVEG
jgi:hypothetical protein